MQDGQVLEYDKPANLLKKEESAFYSLWHEYEAAKA